MIVPFDPFDDQNTDRLTAFRAHFGIDTTVPVVGAYSGRLGNAGERVQLQRPRTNPLLQTVSYLWEDEVLYDADAPWPDVSGNELALVRRRPGGFGSNASNWAAAKPSPGTVEFDDSDFNDDGRIDVQDIDLLAAAMRSNDASSDLDGDERTLVTDLVFLVTGVLQTDVGDANLDNTFNAADLLSVFQAGEYQDQIDGNST